MADPAPVTTVAAEPSLEDNLKRTDRFRLAADESAKYLSTRVSTFILLGIYVAITVSTTTDEMLFRRGNLPLPLLGVGLRIVPFYFVLPLFFLLMHIYIVVQLCILHAKLTDFRAAAESLPTDIRTQQLRLTYPFVFSHLLLGTAENRAVSFIFRFAVLAVLVVFPVVTLLWIQRQFLPLHMVGMTWWHRVCVLTDLAVLAIYWPRRVNHTPAQTGPSSALRSRLCSTGRVLKSTFRRAVIVLAAVSAATVSLGILTVPGEPSDLILPEPDAKRRLEDTSGFDTRRAWYLRLWAPIEPNIPHDEWSLAMFEDRVHRHLDLTGKALVAEPPAPELEAAMLHKGMDRDELWRTYSKPFVLPEGSDLRYAQLDRAKLPMADLSGADLRHAVGSRSDLRSANLESADLRHAILAIINLNGANLRSADLSHSNLYDAGLVASDLGGARLYSTVLDNAQLYGADFSFEELALASLEFAGLQASVWPAYADSGDPLHVRAANLNRAELQGAEMSGVYFAACDFRGAVLSCNRFDGNNFQLCDLQGVQIEALSDDDRNAINEKIRAARPDDPIRVEEARLRLESCTPLIDVDGFTCTDCLIDDDPNGPFAKCNPNKLTEDAFNAKLADKLVEWACADGRDAAAITERYAVPFRTRGKRNILIAERLLAASSSCGPLRELPEDLRTRLRWFSDATPSPE